MDPAVSGAACGAVSRPKAQPWRVVRRGSRQNLVQPPWPLGFSWRPLSQSARLSLSYSEQCGAVLLLCRSKAHNVELAVLTVFGCMVRAPATFTMRNGHRHCF